jgi:signal transduction histidine kinase
MYQREMAARVRSELAALRMERLVEVSAALSRSATQAEVAAVVLTQGLKALYADLGYVALRRGDMLEVVFLPGIPEEHMQRFRRVAMTERLPAVDCVLERKTQIYASPEEMLTRYPDLPSAAWVKTWVFLPMIADDHAVGALCLMYTELTTFSEEDRRYMDLLARQCALALDRARLYEIEQDARKAREEALAISAHDLRNPLSSITMAAALLERHADEKVKSKGRLIRTAAERASELLRELLDAAAIEHGRLRIQIEPCDCAALVRELREMFVLLAEEKGITLQTECAGDLGAIAIDRARMHQALSNLLGNALKFTPAGGTIELRVEAHHGQVRFIVRDTGLGIDPEGVLRLFDRYWQARATKRAGVGLGLYIVKGIVDAHGGTIQVDTAPGAGTTFIISMGERADNGRCPRAAAAP